MGVGPLNLRPAVFVDRDGVLNQAVVRKGRPYPPAEPGELQVLPGVVAACRALRGAGFLVIGVTNQPDVARGTQQRQVVEAINGVLLAQVPLDDMRVCYHDDPDGCTCRKPQPGLLLQAAQDWQIDLAKSYMVGDRWRDMEAGRRAGCTTVLVDYGYNETQPIAPHFRTDSLAVAADWIIQRENQQRIHEVS